MYGYEITPLRYEAIDRREQEVMELTIERGMCRADRQHRHQNRDTAPSRFRPSLRRRLRLLSASIFLS